MSEPSVAAISDSELRSGDLNPAIQVMKKKSIAPVPSTSSQIVPSTPVVVVVDSPRPDETKGSKRTVECQRENWLELNVRLVKNCQVVYIYSLVC